MIKKFLKSVLSLGIITLGIINFSNASWFGHGVVGNYSNNTNNSDYDVMIARYREFNTDYLGTVKRLFIINNGNNSFFWGVNGRLKMSDYAWPMLADVKYFQVCDYINGDFSTFSNCTKYNYSDNVDILNNMLSKIVVGDRFFYGTQNYNSYNLHFQAVNITELNKTVVFYYGNCWASALSDCASSWNGYYPYGIYFNTNDISTDSIGHKRIGLENLDNTNAYNFGNIPNEIIGVSPVFTGGGGSDSGSGEIDGGIELESEESAINYFESNYGRDSSICYVGINNSTDLWGTSVSFQEGSGLTIFQLYDQLYGTGDLNHYYVFVNNWLLNYEQWFNTSGNPMYLSNYNSGTNQVELYYDNLSFPFANNPIAVYFMANNISLKSPGSTMGSEVVSYCNLKLNDGTFEDIIDQSTKNNINNYTEQTNINKGYNADGTARKINIGEFNLNTGSWVISGNLDGGSFTEDYGVSYNTGFNNVSEGFQNLFDKLDSVFSSMSSLGNAYTGILPSYIVFAFLFVVLFKIMRR